VNGNSADKALIVYEAFAKNHHALGRDLILANILGISSPHLDHHHDLAKLAIDGYVPQPDASSAHKSRRYGSGDLVKPQYRW
jgi:hypothetical protein